MEKHNRKVPFNLLVAFLCLIDDNVVSHRKCMNCRPFSVHNMIANWGEWFVGSRWRMIWQIDRHWPVVVVGFGGKVVVVEISCWLLSAVNLPIVARCRFHEVLMKWRCAFESSQTHRNDKKLVYFS